MDNKNLQDAFIKSLNGILTNIDFAKLDASCNSDEDSYAKETLKQMHDAFVEIYGTPRMRLESWSSYRRKRK